MARACVHLSGASGVRGLLNSGVSIMTEETIGTEERSALCLVTLLESQAGRS